MMIGRMLDLFRYSRWYGFQWVVLSKYFQLECKKSESSDAENSINMPEKGVVVNWQVRNKV